MYYMIKGTQIDGEHHYSIKSVVESTIELTQDEAYRKLIECHAFGYDSDDIDPDDFGTYGDGMTSILFSSCQQISDNDYGCLRRLGFAY